MRFLFLIIIIIIIGQYAISDVDKDLRSRTRTRTCDPRIARSSTRTLLEDNNNTELQRSGYSEEWLTY